ncbi:TPA: phage tail length tape measure family protein [Escherichia coli]
MAEPVGDLVVDLSLDAARFDEQMARVRRHFSGTETDAKKTAAVVEQSLSRQALAAQKAGISVGQYKAAMRMLPAQFTDVATQLAGGQSPWLILLQQGGQVKDSFGGMIPMFRGLAGAITLPMVGATSLAVATGALAYAWYQGNSTLSDFNKTLVLSGNQAGLTADRILALSRAGQAAGLTFNQTSESLSALVKAGVSGEAQIASISQSVARFSSASGVEVDKVAEAFGKLTTDPTSGLAASINIKPGHDYYFYIRSVNTVGKSAFVEAVGRASDDAEGYLDFFKGKITESHLGKELLEKVDLTEDNASRLDEFSKEWKDANDKWNAMWGVKIEQTKDGKHYVAGIGLSMEDTEEGKLSQFLVAANRIAFIDPANGNETPMFVAQGNQIFMNDVFLKRLTAPTITSGGSPPVFSLTSDGKLTAKNADISGSVNANSGTLNNVTINQNCTIKGMLEATQVRGDFVKAVSKSFPKQAGTWGNTETPNGTVTVTISDDHNFDRQIIIPPIIFNGIAYSDPGSGNNPGGTRYTGYGFEVRKNGVLIASRETKGAIPGSYSAVIDMPSGRGSVTLEFKVFHKGNQRAGNITDCTVIVTKKAASGISIR